MKINKVTVTGADDSVDIKDLIEISKEFPYVEWGILLSKNSEGRNRFPSFEWIEQLKYSNIKLSGHLCGRWVRDLCKGDWSFIEDRPSWIHLFERVQLNFHSYLHKINENDFIFALKRFHVQYIFQLDNVNNKILNIAINSKIDAVGLFDLSGGAGILPKEWPTSSSYCGYAGGLSPLNLKEQLKKIDADTIWIDAETHLRSNNDTEFDLQKIRKFLIAAKPWVV